MFLSCEGTKSDRTAIQVCKDESAAMKPGQLFYYLYRLWWCFEAHTYEQSSNFIQIEVM